MKALALIILSLATITTDAQSTWSYSSESQIDGVRTDFASTNSLDHRSGHRGLSLNIRCRGIDCKVYLYAPFAVFGDQDTVRVRFGNGEALTYSAARGDSSDALFLSPAFNFLLAAMKHPGTAKIEFRFFSEETSVSTFAVNGLPAPILKRLSPSSPTASTQKPVYCAVRVAEVHTDGDPEAVFVCDGLQYAANRADPPANRSFPWAVVHYDLDETYPAEVDLKAGIMTVLLPDAGERRGGQYRFKVQVRP
jgi:hypothetical protein